jgi:CO/xanthine dehydrogenase Mo-binding subunit
VRGTFLKSYIWHSPNHRTLDTLAARDPAQLRREKARADSVQASTGTSAAAAAAEASESAAEAANLVEMDTETEDPQPEPEPAQLSINDQIDGEPVAGATNGYGVSFAMWRFFNGWCDAELRSC